MGINEIIQIGNRLRKLRIKKGFTQKQMAALTGIPYSTYSNYENNNREPNLEQLDKIADVLGITVYNLIIPGTITTEMEFDSDEEGMLYLDIISNLEKMNIDGVLETKNYTNYLLSNSKYNSLTEPSDK